MTTHGVTLFRGWIGTTYRKLLVTFSIDIDNLILISRCDDCVGMKLPVLLNTFLDF